MLLLLVFLFFGPPLIAQQIANYVRDGGFESLTTCNPFNSLNKLKYWTAADTTKYLFKTYNKCLGNMPASGTEYQWSRSDSGFIGGGFLCTFCNPTVNRSYFRNKLKSNLTAGHTYCVKLYANVKNGSSYGVDRIEAYFGDNSLDTIKYCHVPLTYLNPQIKNANNNIITDTLNWILITGTFVATGVESNILIGNFNSDASTNKTFINPTFGGVWCDILVDDVSCIDVDLPAYAGPDVYGLNGGTLYIGRPDDVGIDEACIWYKLPSATPIATAAGITVTVTPGTSTYVVKQDICGNIKYDTVLVHESFAGFEDLQRMRDDIKIFPVPASELIFVSYTLEEAGKGFTRAKILNSMGQIVQETELSYDDKKAKIILDILPRGVYYLQLTDESLTISKLIIKI